MWQILIGGFAKAIAGAVVARENATTERERIAAGERVKELQARRDVMIAESGSPINALIRGAIAVPFVAYIWKLVLWDKVLGWGATDPLSPILESVLWTVIGFYFLQWTAKTLRKR